MKIELKYDGKNYYDPVFILMWNDEQTNFAIGIKSQDDIDYTFIRKDLLDNYEKFEITGSTFYYYTKENVYVFNLNKKIQIIPVNQNFEHCVVLLDKNDNIILNDYKGFNCIRYEN